MPRPKKQEAPASEPTPPNAAAEAFAKIEPQLAALAADAVLPINVDIPSVVTSVFAASPRIRAYRDAIVEQLPKHPLANVDDLDTYAYAAWYAHLLHTYASTGPDAAKGLLEEAAKLRESLLIAAEALAHRGLLDGEAVGKIRKGSGNLDMANDLGALGALFKAQWARVSTKTAVERHEVDRAAELGPAVLVALAVRKPAGKPTDTADDRARAFTLLANTYDGCRRALTYLRWADGDVDAIAPSLYTKKRGPRAKANGKVEAPVEGAEAPAPPVAAEGDA